MTAHLQRTGSVKTFHITSQAHAYKVVVGRGAWRTLRRFPLSAYSSIFILTERGLWQKWGRLFLQEAGLSNRGSAGILPARGRSHNRGLHAKRVENLFVPAGEPSKSLNMVERVAGGLLKRGADRHSLLIAVGGGVLGDLGGFVASSYMRGIDYINVPTTLLAQVDSAVGGKTAVNVGAMKNLVGTFYPPRLVLAEPAVLRSMGRRAFRSGLYEVVKHGILEGLPLFGVLERRLDRFRPANAGYLGPLLARAVQVKVDVVRRDEREAELRLALNLGHTFGHAFEEATHYRRFTHGEAVGWGLLVVTRLAARLGRLAPAEAARIDRLVRRVGPLPPIRDLDPARILRLLRQDKKAISGKIRWVLPQRIGKIRIATDVPQAEVAAALRDVQSV
jgi:3-dehydroquinate synthase